MTQSPSAQAALQALEDLASCAGAQVRPRMARNVDALRQFIEAAAPKAPPMLETDARAYALLFECSRTLAMWADVAPAVSLRKDIGDWLRAQGIAAKD